MVSNIGNPGDFTPVYNPVVFYFNSTNKNQLGFRYVVDLYYAGTSTKIAEFRVAPRPTDGYGYIDLSKILSTLITYNFNGTNNSVLAQPNAQVKYDLKIGEEYVINYNISSFTNVGNYVRVTTAANTFTVNDQVVINDPLLTGLFTVITDTSTTQITIDAPWQSSYSGATTGTISYADNRKTITRDLLTYSNYTVYNAAFSFADFKTYDKNNYILDDTAFPVESLLTDMPQTYYAYQTQDIWVNYAPYYLTTATYMYFENSNGDVFRKNIQDGTVAIKQAAVGPNNAGTLSLVSGTAGLIKANTTWYKFWVADSGGLTMTKQYTINLLNECKIEDYEVVFLDRKGSFGSFAFPLRAKKQTKVEADRYNNQIGDVSGGKYTYNTYDIWNTTTNVDYDTVLELNTNWFKSTEQLEYYDQLISSPYTFIKIGILYYQCTVEDKSNEINSLNNKKLQMKTLKVKLINEIINI